MYKLGIEQTLIIKRITSVGAFLNTDMAEEDDVLLPKKYLKKSKKPGDEVRVFVYKDNENRPVATTLKPKIQLGGLAILQVKDLTKIGAFLDWGLDKDLLLPFDEQVGGIKKYDYHLVALYLDKSQRFSATMKLDAYFDKNPPYKENDWVDGIIYAFNRDIGAFIIVDGKYNALLSAGEIEGIPKVGDHVHLRVKNVKDDGKLDLSHMNRSHETIGLDSEKIYNILKDNGGFLRINDKSNPKLIFSIFKMSKAQFKRAVGRLYKQRRIRIGEDGISLNRGGRNGN